MDFNNIQQRISLLYKAIELYYDFKQPMIPVTEEGENNGKRYLTVKLGAGITTEDEKLDFFNRIILIIHNIANIKDNLKKFLSERNLNQKVVEMIIDDSIHLSIIADLSNSEKHGYPLTKTRRSKLDPKITNIRKSWDINFPLSKVYHNIMDSNVQFKADIVDFNDNFICDFDELIEKAIENWEDFFIKNLNEVSGEILLIRENKIQKNKQILKVQQTINEVNKIIQSSEWINVSWQELVVGMIVRNIQRENNLTNSTGIIVEQFIDGNALPIIKLKDDSPFGIINFHVEKYNWQVIKIVKPNDLMVLSYYYYNCDVLFQSIN
ncbi:hypothetical protein [Flavobacterium sp. NRK F7]|uniref:hypothetical protein n=1 Tax=Flavobacterium sp. NRK F7 TaxID=2954930 RepID=UPI00209124B5|nr:hypothetical protein [Flavobacterium sp. NRK F7]MCO6163661.1 hypothetical protein [Flavobacterium sp. NRK F7]